MSATSLANGKKKKDGKMHILWAKARSFFKLSFSYIRAI